MNEESPGGIEVMRQRIQRASRQPPPPKRPAPARSAAASAPETATAAARPAPAPTPTSSPPQRSRRSGGATVAHRRTIAAGEAPVNLAIRVRRPLDDHLANLIHGMRQDGIRTSKVELIEMLLWELPDGQGAEQQLRERLREFRQWAPRHGDALPPSP